MKYDKTTIIGVGICVILLLLWPKISQRMMPPAPPRTAGAERADGEQPGAPQVPPVGETQTPTVQPTAPTPDADVASEASAEQPTAQTPPEAALAPTTVGTRLPPDTARGPEPNPHVVLSPPGGETSFSLDTVRGGISDITLREYSQELGKDGSSNPVILGKRDYPFVDLAAPAPWQASEGTLSRTPDGGSVARVLTNPGGQTLELTETWQTAKDDPYRLSYTITVANTGGNAVDLDAWTVSAGCMPLSVTPGANTSMRAGGAGGTTYARLNGGRPETLSQKNLGKMDAEEQAEMQTTPAEWVAVHSKYFMMWLAEEDAPFAGLDLRMVPFKDATAAADDEPDHWYRARAVLPKRVLAPGTRTVYKMQAYAGPKNYDRLAALGKRTETVMDMDRFMWMHPGWMGFITRFLLRALVWLRSIFDFAWGYGVAIIVITVGVKVLFWPLSHHSTKSMRKMQKLQPQLKELREKYKDDPQKLYRKQGELFKANNVSQLGGCMPMVLQIPVFFALFNTFRSAIELRHAPFLWVQDLSMPDTLAFSPGSVPIRPLAIMMGITMLLQQKLSPSGTDPQQQRMMMFMSVFFIFLFYSMPSGLTLYWTVNQVLTIAQMLVMQKLEEGKGEDAIVVPA